jgi:hypothetical protein
MLLCQSVVFLLLLLLLLLSSSSSLLLWALLYVVFVLCVIVLERSPLILQAKSDFPESDVNELLEMGYTKPQVHEALTVCNGDRQAAAWYLLENSKK